MATIGLDKLYYASITEDANGNETYGSPVVLAKAMSANLTINIDEATLWADDGAAENVKEFKDGTISLGIDDIGSATAAALCGVTVDDNGVVVSTAEDITPYVAIGFRAKKANGKFRYFWLYRVKFGAPGIELATKGDSITFSTPTIEGTIYRRNKLDSNNKHPWKVEATEGAAGVSQTVINNWYNAVYEPGTAAADATLSALSIGTVALSPTFNSNVTAYTATVTAASNAVTATATDTSNAHVAITVNDVSIASGGNGTFVTGTNIVKVTVTNGTTVMTYVVTVTK